MYKKSDLTLLIMIVALVSASIAVLYGRKMWADADATPQGEKSPRIILKYQDTIDYLQPYLIAGGMDAAAAALSQFASSVQHAVLDALIQGVATALTDEQKVELLGSLLAHNPTERTKSMVIPLLYRYFTHVPLFVWLIPNYEKIVPIIVSYDEQRGKKQHPDQLKNWINQSLLKAVNNDDSDALAALITLDIIPDKEYANKLLEKVINEGRSTAFIPLLINQLGADPNYSPDGKKTVLMLAVEKNNGALVKMLLAQGASAQKVLDKAVGNARQVAFERGYTAIEGILLQKKLKK